jgi:hypothetical protein
MLILRARVCRGFNCSCVWSYIIVASPEVAGVVGVVVLWWVQLLQCSGGGSFAFHREALCLLRAGTAPVPS